MERRDFLKLAAAGVAGLILPYHNEEYLPRPINRPEVLGLTFSQRQCDLLGFPEKDYKIVFHSLLNKLNPDIVRLCVYWDEFEDKSPERIDYLVNHLEKTGKKFILAFGAKSPRFEEIHLPGRMRAYVGDYSGKNLGEDNFFSDQVLQFDESIILRYRNCSSLEYFQGENEPLDPLSLTKQAVIGEKLVFQTTQLLKSLKKPDQKILSTNSVPLINPLQSIDRILFNSNLSDAIGLNIYSKIPNRYRLGGYDNADNKFWAGLHKIIYSLSTIFPDLEIWSSELQAEPWEDGLNGQISAVSINKRSYPSSSPRQSINLLSQTTNIGINKCLLWGGEYWVFQEMRGFPEWIETYEPVFKSASTL